MRGPRKQGSRACRRGGGHDGSGKPPSERPDDDAAAERIVWADGPRGWRRVRERIPGDPGDMRRVPIVPVETIAERMVSGLLELGELIEDAELAELKVREHLLNLGGWTTLVTAGFLLSTRRRHRRRKKGTPRG
jgi:hypothetical protein